METKNFYYDGIWDAIVNHPQFDIGRREFEALVRFMPTVGRYGADVVNILHLGVGDGREIPLFINHLKVGLYVLNDICTPLLERVAWRARQAHPDIQFSKARTDIEKAGAIAKLRKQMKGQALVVLVGNAVIFSNRSLNNELRQALYKNDLFLVTAETPHEKMFQSYTIEPVYRLLAQSGLDVSENNTSVWYDKSDQCLKMSCRDQVLLASYKPKPEELDWRLESAGMTVVTSCEYKDIHMVAGLYKKK